MNRLEINKSCGNVFLDLGLRDMEWTQAQVLGISQSRVSNFVRGKFEKFSLDMLITLTTLTAKKVELKNATEIIRC